MSNTAAHALLGASSAKRWIACPPSARLTEHMVEEESEYAKEGTQAHELGELKTNLWLKKIDQKAFKAEHAKIKKRKHYNVEMEHCTDEYCDYIQLCANSYAVTPHVQLEQRVDFSEWVPEGFGTADCLIIGGNELHVIDYKHGRGIAVSAVDNPQMRLYAAGAYRRYSMFYNIETVRYSIVQPRNGGITTDSMTVSDLFQWLDDVVVPAAKLAHEGAGGYCAGEWCDSCFCKANATCRARANAAVEAVTDTQLDLLPPLITEAEMGDILTKLESAIKYHKKLKDAVYASINNGQPVPGWKLVAGQSKRTWIDDLTAANILTAQHGVAAEMLYTTNLKTVAALEGELGKAAFKAIEADLVLKTPGNPVLAEESDKRPSVTSASMDFAAVMKKEEE